MTHHIQSIQTEQAPAAVGPYSQAISHQGLVYSSGQIGLIPQQGKMVGDTVEEQAQQVVKNLTAVLEASGSSPQSVLKATIFLVDMNDFSAVNAIYAEWLGNHRPARSTVCVASLPLGALVEIDVVAVQEK